MPNRWRNGSIFGLGLRAPLCRESRAQYKAKLLIQRRPGRLTIAAAQVGRVLVDMLGRDGRLDPALETIAAKARVSISTVKRSLAQLRAAGFLTWTRRLIRCAAGGWRTEQTSNAYILTVPACEAQIELAVMKRRISKGRQLSDKENAARQLLTLGATVPPEWGITL